MDDTPLADELCLRPDERHEVEAAWRALQARLQPLGELIEQADTVKCDELHALFLNMVAAFDKLERAVMRAKQIRLLHAAHQE